MHKNIVSALRHGKVRYSPYYFFDMELCDFNLATHIHKWRQTVPENGVNGLLRLAEIGNIITDITNGIAFVHLHGETHRDLKPRNGIKISFLTNTFSPLFFKRECMENRRFWPYS